MTLMWTECLTCRSPNVWSDDDIRTICKTKGWMTLSLCTRVKLVKNAMDRYTSVNWLLKCDRRIDCESASMRHDPLKDANNVWLKSASRGRINSHPVAPARLALRWKFIYMCINQRGQSQPRVPLTSWTFTSRRESVWRSNSFYSLSHPWWMPPLSNCDSQLHSSQFELQWRHARGLMGPSFPFGARTLIVPPSRVSRKNM